MNASLTGRSWRLQSIADGREYLALPEGVQSTLAFDDGGLSVDCCNTGGADATITESTIVIESIITTEIRCEPRNGQVTERSW